MLPFKFLHCYSLRRFLWPVGFVVNSYPYTALCLHWGNVPDDFSGKQEVCDGPGATSAPTAAQQDAELLQQSQTWNHSMPSSSIPCNEDGHYKSSHWVTCQPCRPFSWSICGGGAAQGCSGSWDRRVCRAACCAFRGCKSQLQQVCRSKHIFRLCRLRFYSCQRKAHPHWSWKQRGRQQDTVQAHQLPAHSSCLLIL